MTTDVRMPKLGQAMAEGTVVEWHAQPGATVEAGSVLVTIETDKSTYDIEAAATGVLTILVEAGAEVAVGTVLGRIGASGSPEHASSSAATPTPASARAAGAAPSPSSAAATAHAASGAQAPRGPQRVVASPKARRIAQELGIDLASVSPSDGTTISAEDVESAHAGANATSTGPRRRELRRAPLTGVRRTAARRLQASWQSIPHIVQMVDVDAGALLAHRESLRAQIDGLTVNDLLLHTAASVLAGLPALNVALGDDDQVISYDGVDIGFAVESPRGLLVPVIRGADRRSLAELVAERMRLVEAARAGALGPDDMGDASLTLSNLGMYGIRAGTPVINPGEPLLIFAGAIEPRPVAHGDAVRVRPMMTLSVAYDHRLVDGVAAAGCTKALKDRLEALGDAQPTATRATAATRLAAQLELTAQSRGAGYAVDVRGGGHAWSLDEPEALGGTNTGPDPVRAFLGALLGCMVVAFKASALRRKVPLEGVTASLRADGPIPTRIDIDLVVAGGADQTTLDALAASAKRTCRVSAMLNPAVPVALTVTRA